MDYEVTRLEYSTLIYSKSDEVSAKVYDDCILIESWPSKIAVKKEFLEKILEVAKGAINENSN